MYYGYVCIIAIDPKYTCTKCAHLPIICHVTEPEGKEWAPESLTKHVVEDSLIGITSSPLLAVDDDATVWVVMNKNGGYEQKILQVSYNRLEQ